MAKNRIMTENNISVIKFANNKVPEFKEVRGKDWIAYGEKNDYPDYLLTLFNRSAKHNAIVTGKVHYIKGQGLIVKDDSLTIDKKAELEYFLKNINESDTADELLYKISTDLELFGGFALQIIPNRIKTNISQICHIDFSKLRVDKDKDNIWYCNDWKCPKPENGLMELSPFDPETFSGVYYFTQYRPGISTYPMPEYMGAIPYIEMDYEISNFHLNNIKNGFSAGTMISFNNGEPDTEEAKRNIEGLVKKKTIGTDNAGQLLITFANGKDSAPTVAPLTPNNFDKLFDTLNQTVQQEIFTGHKVTSPMLFGIKTEGQLGGRSELREASELFQNSYIAAKQTMIENELNYIMTVAGYGPVLEIQPTEPIAFDISEQAMMQVLTKNEIRAKLGLAPIEAQQTQTMQKFSSQDEVNVFMKYGFSKDEFEILKSEEIEDKEEANLKELAFYINKQSFDKKDDEVQGPDPSDIRDPKFPKLVPEQIKVMYSYEVRKGLGPEIIEGTRDLCRQLIKLNKLYSREDINKISKELGYDVWEKRGGFYHNPKTDITTPYCRHIWSQNLVRKNG